MSTFNKNTLRKLYNQWRRGERSKTEIERTEFGVTTARGKYVTRLWASKLNLNSSTLERV